VSVNVTACASDIYELSVVDAVRFGALTANVDVVLLPIVPVDDKATVFAATAVYELPPVIPPVTFKKYVPVDVLAVLV